LAPDDVYGRLYWKPGDVNCVEARAGLLTIPGGDVKLAELYLFGFEKIDGKASAYSGGVVGSLWAIICDTASSWRI
jgi:hypothetical protein